MVDKQGGLHQEGKGLSIQSLPRILPFQEGQHIEIVAELRLNLRSQQFAPSQSINGRRHWRWQDRRNFLGKQISFESGHS